jgi:hypothetical protein
MKQSHGDTISTLKMEAACFSRPLASTHYAQNRSENTESSGKTRSVSTGSPAILIEALFLLFSSVTLAKSGTLPQLFPSSTLFISHFTIQCRIVCRYWHWQNIPSLGQKITMYTEPTEWSPLCWLPPRLLSRILPHISLQLSDISSHTLTVVSFAIVASLL